MKRNLMMNMTLTALMIVSLTGTGAIGGIAPRPVPHAPAFGASIAATATAASTSEETSRDEDDDEESSGS
ncbi:MAG: hypothetical protein II916_03680 [Oscillospiraceae bacterium]|nr:hypothetical protein [Oscillospiraceae bacterium]